MKRLMIYLLLCLPLLLVADASVDAAFQQAVEAYQAQNYEEALGGFLQLQEHGTINADLAYNTGNCYFRLQQMGMAILYYKRALLIDPAHAMARKNLEFAMSLTVDKQQPAEQDAFTRSVSTFFARIPVNLLAFFTLVLFACIIATLCWMIIWWRGREKTVPIFILTILLIAWVISGFSAHLKWRQFHHNNEGVIIANTVMGYSGPNTEYTRVFTVHEGMTCEIERSQKGWSLIKLPNGLGGWVENSTFKSVRW